MSSRVCVTALAVSLFVLAPTLLVAQRQTRYVFVDVVDSTGKPVPGLGAKDFDVKEGDAQRTVTAVGLSNGPMRIMLLIDTGSAFEPFLTQLRAALGGLVDALPEGSEIGVMSLGRQARARIQPSTDRVKLKNELSKFTLDGGGVAFFDGLRDSEDRFQKKAGVRWPVYVMLVGDENEASANIQPDELNRIMADLSVRGTTIHAAILEKMGPTPGTQIAANLANSTRGSLEKVTTPAALPDLMKKIGARIAADLQAMSTRYQVEYTTDAKYQGGISVGSGSGTVTISQRRPF